MVELMAPFRSSGNVDPGWEHGVAQDDKKKKVQCNYCGKVVSGGIYRLKQHLARVSGEVTYCDKAPEEVCLRMKDNLEGSRSTRRAKQLEDDVQACPNAHYEDNTENIMHKSKGKHLVFGLAPVRPLTYVDPGWEYGVAQDERKKKVKCNYCDKVVSGGINRFKQHLARIPGEVAPCKSAPEEVYHKIKENMKWHRAGRRHRQPDTSEMSAFVKESDTEDDECEYEQDDLLQLSKGRLTIGDKRLQKDSRMTLKGMAPVSSCEPLLKKSRLDSVFLNSPHNEMARPPSCKQLRVKGGSSRKARKEVISAICKFFYHAGVPLQAANSLYFHKMLQAVGQYGPGLVGPQSQVISDHFLHEEIATIRNFLVEYKASWAITGCSIMADSWTDIEGKTLINLLVSCPHGLYFVASVDASYMVEDALSLFKLLDKVVEEMGEENVVQVITENTPSYKAAGRMLEERRRNLFWTPCASYCIDRILEDFLTIKCVEECMMKGQKITKFLYNHIYLLNLLKEFTKGQELVRPAATRYLANFTTLQSLLDHRTSLRRMLQSSKWTSSRFSKSHEGKEVEKLVSNAAFWKKMQHVTRSVDPVLQVFQKVDSGENLSMPFIYNDMYRVKLAIKSIHADDTRKYGPFWDVLDNHLNSWLCHPLYMAAYFLNPSYRYHSDFMAHSEVVRGLNECIFRLEPDNMRRVAASKQISDYISAKGDFGTELAISTRSELDPAAWWIQHGISCLELQRIAVRILSQTCSSIGCEHSWSIYDQIHIQKPNRLSRKRLDDLVFVHYNLRLRERQLKKRCSASDSTLQEHLVDDWIVEAQEHVLKEYEETICNENGSTYEDASETGLVNFQDGTTEGREGNLELGTLVESEALDVNHDCTDDGTSDDDDDDNNNEQAYFDSGLSD